MTNEEIQLQQNAIRAFYATETGRLLLRFKNAHSNANIADMSGRVSDKRLLEAWASSDLAEDLLIASIKLLQDALPSQSDSADNFGARPPW